MYWKILYASVFVGFTTLDFSPARAYIDPCRPSTFPKTQQWQGSFQLGGLNIRYIGQLSHFVNETKPGQSADIVQDTKIYFDDLTAALNAIVNDANNHLPKDDCKEWANISSSRFQIFPPNLNIKLKVDGQKWLCVGRAKTKGFKGDVDVNIDLFPKMGADGNLTIGSSQNATTHVSKETQFLAGLIGGPSLGAIFTRIIKSEMARGAAKNLDQITDIVNSFKIPQLPSPPLSPEWNTRYVGFEVHPYGGQQHVVLAMLRTYELDTDTACTVYRGLNQ